MHCKHVQDVFNINLRGFIVMALCGGLCMTENSSTPRQGNAEDRADYSSFSALSSRVSNIDFNVELKSNEANSISHRWYRQHAYIHASQLMRKACRFKILTNWPVNSCKIECTTWVVHQQALEDVFRLCWVLSFLCEFCWSKYWDGHPEGFAWMLL